VLAETISRISLRQIEVWYSSDPLPAGGLRPGQVWADEIKSQLLASRAILVVLTRTSLDRPWLYFESGYVSSQDCQVVPLCLGIGTRDVPLPLAMFQCYELNDYESLAHFCKKFFSQLQISFDEEMAAPILRCAAKSLKSLNRQWLEIFGYQREEVIGKPADFLMTSESAELAMLVVIPAFWEQGFCQDIPYQYKKRDGTLVNVLLNCYAMTDDNGKKISLSFVQVVSNQERLWHLQQESEARYSQRLQGESAGFYETDLFGNFTTVNDYLSQLLGLASAEEVVGRNFRDVLDYEGAKNIFKAHHAVFTNRTSKSSNIWTIRRSHRISR
jgi:PAS domain S-box-containing protein